MLNGEKEKLINEINKCFKEDQKNMKIGGFTDYEYLSIQHPIHCLQIKR